MKKFVRLDSVLTIKKENGFYTWSRDGGEKHKGRSAAASIYNGKEVYGWVLLSVKNYYDKIQG